MTESQDLTAVLSEQIRCAQAMLDALARENRALLESNTDELCAATTAKTTLVARLETLEEQRRGLAAAVTERAKTITESEQLRRLVSECKSRNDKNGALLQARAANVRVALKALRGTEPELYGREGRAPARSTARPLGTA